MMDTEAAGVVTTQLMNYHKCTLILLNMFYKLYGFCYMGTRAEAVVFMLLH